MMKREKTILRTRVDLGPNINTDIPTELYRHFDADGRLLYVGIAMNPLARLAQHRYGRAPWFDQIQRIEISRFRNRLEAVRAERRAIKEEAPLFNIVYRDLPNWHWPENAQRVGKRQKRSIHEPDMERA
jgi:hypothetical protein